LKIGKKGIHRKRAGKERNEGGERGKKRILNHVDITQCVRRMNGKGNVLRNKKEGKRLGEKGEARRERKKIESLVRANGKELETARRGNRDLGRRTWESEEERKGGEGRGKQAGKITKRTNSGPGA